MSLTCTNVNAVLVKQMRAFLYLGYSKKKGISSKQTVLLFNIKIAITSASVNIATI